MAQNQIKNQMGRIFIQFVYKDNKKERANVNATEIRNKK